MTYLVRSNLRLISWAIGLMFLVVCMGGRAQQPSTQHIYVALYERGPEWISGKSVQEFPDFQQHLAHVHAIESRLLGIGPFAETPGETTVGMAVFFAASDEAARKLAESDPFVVAKYTRVTKTLRWQVSNLKGCT